VSILKKKVETRQILNHFGFELLSHFTLNPIVKTKNSTWTSATFKVFPVHTTPYEMSHNHTLEIRKDIDSARA